MSSTTTSFTEEQQRTAAQTAFNADYVLTEEEKLVLAECNRESFFYRSLPFAVLSIGVTQALIVKGFVSVSPRVGPVPKLAFAGFCGYLAGKLSYMKTCQDKLRRLENSPLGEILRQQIGMPSPSNSTQQQPSSKGQQSEMRDPYTRSFGTMFQPADAPSSMSTHNRDYGYGYHPDPPAQMGRASDFNAPAQSYVEEEEPKKKPILYEDLRLKNRENYEVTLTQKADSLLRPPTEGEPERTKKEVKKNIYGDTWEE